MLIPTRLKLKLPQTLSYPIGSEAVSERLLGVPQFEKLEISFTPPFLASASTFQAARKQNQPYKIFQISMIHPIKGLTSSNQFIEEGYYDENWKIDVYAVPRELKSAAKNLLLNEGLPSAKQWLEAPRTETWKTGRKHFHVLFHEKENIVSIKQD